MPPNKHLSDANGLPRCGTWVRPDRLRNSGSHQVRNRLVKPGQKPTCTRCLAILAGRRPAADPRDTASKYGKLVD